MPSRWVPRKEAGGETMTRLAQIKQRLAAAPDPDIELLVAVCEAAEEMVSEGHTERLLAALAALEREETK